MTKTQKQICALYDLIDRLGNSSEEYKRHLEVDRVINYAVKHNMLDEDTALEMTEEQKENYYQSII